MSPAFISGAPQHFPKAGIVFVMKGLNTAVDMVRREKVKERVVLRKTKYLWLKNRTNMTEKEKLRLAAIESMPMLNLRTVRAMHIRENFQSLYAESDKAEFELGLKKWYWWATHCRIDEMQEAAKTIKRHWYGVVAWAESRISNGLLEGLNSLIQAAKAKARGYCTFETFRTIVFMLTGKLGFSTVGLPT